MNNVTRPVGVDPANPTTFTFPNGSNRWRLLSAPAGAQVTLVFDDKSKTITKRGGWGESENPFKEIEVWSSIAGSVTIEWGHKGYTFDAPEDLALSPDVGLPGTVTYIPAGGRSAIIDGSGYGTAVLRLHSSTNSRVRILDPTGLFYLPVRDFNGRAIPRGIFFADGTVFDWNVIIDLAGFGGFIVESLVGDATFTYLLSSQTHPYSRVRQLEEFTAGFIANGSTPYAGSGGGTLFALSDILRNDGDEFLDMQLIPTGGDGSPFIITLLPYTNVTGNYPGAPIYMSSAAVDKKHYFSFNLKTGQGMYDIEGTAGGYFNGPIIGAFDYRIAIMNTGASNWGLTQMHIIRLRP